MNQFLLETLVDFPDDALHAPFPLTERHIDAMMAAFKAAGIQRVSWGTYADTHGHYILPILGGKREVAAYDNWEGYARTLEVVGNPLGVAVEAAHRYGMEIYGYFKPFENAPCLILPAGAPEARQWGKLEHIGGQFAWLDPFVVQHPHLRIKRRSDDLAPDIKNTPVHAIKLIKKDDSPTRIRKQHLQIWASPDNYRYRPLDVSFELTDSVETAPREVLDITDKIVTRQGDPVRVLTLSGFRLADPYILVTTSFTDGPADFENVCTDMLRAFDERGREIPGVFANGTAIWCDNRIDFRNWGLVFDHGWSRVPMKLDEPNASGKQGFIAYTRGRAEYLGALCESEPEVQDYWLHCIDLMLDTGVDGVDIREENHSTQTEFPDDYGFNQVILNECERRGSELLSTMAQVRGDAYTDFLRQAKNHCTAHGKPLRYNLNLDYMGGNSPMNRRLAFPANLEWQWRRWMEEGIMDEAVLRFYTKPFDCLFDDELTESMVALAGQCGIPVTVNRYLSYEPTEDTPWTASIPENVNPNLAYVAEEQPKHIGEYQRVRDDGRFAGFILYEADAFMTPTEDGGYSITHPVVKELCRLANNS